MREREIRYYSDFTDDFEQSADQDHALPENYEWVRTGFFARIASALTYGFWLFLSWFYLRFRLHLRVKGRKKLKGARGGFFLFCNHTQPVGDVFIPAHALFPRRIYTVVGTANFGIPVIGKILPYLGALPVTGSVDGLRKLTRAMEVRLSEGHPVVIYPEAHVWKYYTGIRPFPDTPFRYPVKLGAQSYAMTVTYRKSKIWRRPVTEVFLDGPFSGDGAGVRDKTADLCGKIRTAMEERSRNSNVEYIEYRKK